MCDAGLIDWMVVEGAVFFYEFLPISLKLKTLMHISHRRYLLFWFWFSLLLSPIFVLFFAGFLVFAPSF